MDLHAPSRAASLLGGPRPGMRSSRCPFGRLLGRNWFKCYRYFVTDILVWQRPPKVLRQGRLLLFCYPFSW
jgi:hypothetical protein